MKWLESERPVCSFQCNYTCLILHLFTERILNHDFSEYQAVAFRGRFLQCAGLQFPDCRWLRPPYSKLHAYIGKLCNETISTRKICFYDTGIRNALLANFNHLNIRQDTGALWRNSLVFERMKHLHYNGIWAQRFFWRTTAHQEIDCLKERDGKLYAYEF